MSSTEVEIVATLRQLVQDTMGKPRQKRIAIVRNCYLFLEKSEVFAFAMDHPKLLLAIFRKAEEFMSDMIAKGDIDIELMNAIEHIREMYGGYLRPVARSFPMGLISPSSPLSILDGAVVQQIMDYRKYDLYLPIIAAQLDKCLAPFVPAGDTNDSLFETYHASPVHRWAKIWLDCAIAHVPMELPECCELYCDKCTQVTYATGHTKCTCNCGCQLFIVRLLPGQVIPPWINMDTYTRKITNAGEIANIKRTAFLRPC